MTIVENNYGVEYISGDDVLEDIPDAPRDPERSGGSGRKREVSLKNYRLRFNWDPPDENKTAYLDDGEGLAPGQSPVDYYKVVVQKKDGSWQTVETETTSDRFYIFHATPDVDDLTKEYRALIYSVDKENNESATYLNSNTGNTGKIIEGGGGGDASQPPNKPSAPSATRRVRAVLLEWDETDSSGNDQPEEAKPIVYEIHVKKSSASWPATDKHSKVGHTQGSSFLVKKYFNGYKTNGDPDYVDFVKGDYLNTFNFRLRAKSKISGTYQYAVTNDGYSDTINSKPARGPLQTVGTDKPDAPTQLHRSVIGPRKIMWDWAESTDPTVARYKITIMSATAVGGPYTNYKNFFTQNSYYKFDVPEADLAKFWKATLYAQTALNDAGTRVDSNAVTDEAGGSQVADFAAVAKVVPSSPTNVTAKRYPRKMIIRWYHEPTDAMGDVKYQVHITQNSGFTPSSNTKVGVIDGNKFVATQWNNGGVLKDFTKFDAKKTFFIVIVAKNSKGTARSAQISSSPAEKLVASKNDTNDDDVYEIKANRFVADDNTSADRIIIADTDSTKAQIRFVGINGQTVFSVKGGGGNVEVTQGYVKFSGGLVLPYQGGNGIPNTATGINGSIGVSANRLWWRGSNGWRYVNVNSDGITINGGLG